MGDLSFASQRVAKTLAPSEDHLAWPIAIFAAGKCCGGGSGWEWGYIVGLAKNERLQALSAKLQKRAERKYRKSGRKVRLFSALQYKAKTWDKKRRGHRQGPSTTSGEPIRVTWLAILGVVPRHFTTSFTVHGGRWKIESKNSSWVSLVIAPVVTPGGLTSSVCCFPWAAYVLLEASRRIGLSGTDLARAQVTTIRLRLLKIGARSVGRRGYEIDPPAGGPGNLLLVEIVYSGEDSLRLEVWGLGRHVQGWVTSPRRPHFVLGRP